MSERDGISKTRIRDREDIVYLAVPESFASASESEIDLLFQGEIDPQPKQTSSYAGNVSGTIKFSSEIHVAAKVLTDQRVILEDVASVSEAIQCIREKLIFVQQNLFPECVKFKNVQACFHK